MWGGERGQCPPDRPTNRLVCTTLHRPPYSAVAVNGQPMGDRQVAVLSGAIEVYAAHAAGAAPTRVQVTTPVFSIRAVQRKANKSWQSRDPLYGQWLDLYVTLKKPLPLPVGGLLGPSYNVLSGKEVGSAGAGRDQGPQLTASITYGGSGTR